VRRYWRFLVPAGVLVAVLVFLLVNLSSSLVYFITPTELIDAADGNSDRQRLGGQVVEGTVIENADGVAFSVTDGRVAVPVVHSGAPQDLFAEGIGVVLEGTWDGGTFHSDTMLIRHDEQYRTEEGEDYDPDHPDEFTS
jgi:cytochrome c-type biogenesis protein CcmE